MDKNERLMKELEDCLNAIESYVDVLPILPILNTPTQTDDSAYQAPA
jgi:hypothetical protein